MRRFLRWIHKWFALLVGVFLIVLAVTGASLVFERELLPVAIGTPYRASVSSARPLSFSDLYSHIRQCYPDKDLKSMEFPSDPNRNVLVRFRHDPGKDYFFNPYSGQMEGSFVYQKSFFGVMRTLHRTLFMKSAGKILIGIITILITFILLSGLWLYILHRRLSMNRFFKIRFGGSRVGLLFDLHTVLGSSFLILLLLMSCSGPYWSFGWYKSGFSGLFGVNSVVNQTSMSR